jgi:hypothetical protein
MQSVYTFSDLQQQREGKFEGIHGVDFKKYTLSMHGRDEKFVHNPGHRTWREETKRKTLDFMGANVKLNFKGISCDGEHFFS